MKKIAILTLLLVICSISFVYAGVTLIDVYEKEIDIININETVRQVALIQKYSDGKEVKLNLEAATKWWKIKNKDDNFNIVFYIDEYNHSCSNYLRFWIDKDKYIDISIDNMLSEPLQHPKNFYARNFIQYDYAKQKVVIDDFKTIDKGIMYFTVFAILFSKLFLAKLLDVKKYNKIVSILSVTTVGMLLFFIVCKIWNIYTTFLAWGILFIIATLIEYYFHRKKIDDIDKSKLMIYSLLSNIVGFFIVAIDYFIFII